VAFASLPSPPTSHTVPLQPSKKVYISSHNPGIGGAIEARVNELVSTVYCRSSGRATTPLSPRSGRDEGRCMYRFFGTTLNESFRFHVHLIRRDSLYAVHLTSVSANLRLCATTTDQSWNRVKRIDPRPDPTRPGSN